MGEFKAHIGIMDARGGSTRWVDAKVDTGATFTILPTSLLTAQGIQRGRRATFTLADKSVVDYHMGEARLVIEGVDLSNVVVFGPEGKFLLGATTLQTFGLIPDTTNHKLIPAPELSV